MPSCVLLNGSRGGDADPTGVDEVATMLAQALSERGFAVERIELRDEKVAPCQGDFDCWVKSPGLCRIDDAGRDIARAIMQSDLVVFLSAVTFGGYASPLKKAVDRLICLVSPFFRAVDGQTHHELRYDRYPSLLGVGVMPHEDPEQQELFGELVRRNWRNLGMADRASAFVVRDRPLEVQREALRRALAPLEVA